jgi:large subunit ribosomal protein L2
MAIKSFRPKTHSLRFKTVLDYKQELTTDEPFKPLLESKNRIDGRNSYGRLSVRHRGGGNKKHYRIVDFKRDKTGIPAKVETIEYDPNRSAFLALLSYADGERRYILQPQGLKVGMSVVSRPTSLSGMLSRFATSLWVPRCTTSSFVRVKARRWLEAQVPQRSWLPKRAGMRM